MILTETIESLFSVFADTFALPIAWPLSEYPTFVSAGVWAGNVNLEFIRPRAANNRTPTPGLRARFGNIALEPTPLKVAVEELNAREIPHLEPSAFVARGADGKPETRSTIVMLRGFGAFLCEYNFDVEARRKGTQRELKKRAGGPLGVVELEEIIIGTSAFDDHSRRWQRLLDPLQPTSAGRWKIGDGPAIWLVPASENAIQAIVIRISSLAKARKFLAEEGLLGKASDTEIRIAPHKLQGLDIRLRE